MTSLSLIVLFVIFVGSGFLVINYYFSPQREVANRLFNPSSGEPADPFSNLTPQQIEIIKESKNDEASSSKTATIEEKFFRAGILSDTSKKIFRIFQIISPIICTPLVAYLASPLGGIFVILGAILGFIGGLQLPISYLDRAVAKRDEDIMFYLPLVIEQLVIGVSSSLEIGPCLSRVVSMADERDSHNAVTELLRYVQQLIRSGASLDEALKEVGTLAGHTELKHAFMTLGQVAKHGGEISKQLQELANSVSAQRETKIEARIKRLELDATAPVAIVFLCFMAVLLVGIGLQFSKVFAN